MTQMIAVQFQLTKSNHTLFDRHGSMAQNMLCCKYQIQTQLMWRLSFVLNTNSFVNAITSKRSLMSTLLVVMQRFQVCFFLNNSQLCTISYAYHGFVTLRFLFQLHGFHFGSAGVKDHVRWHLNHPSTHIFFGHPSFTLWNV